MVCQKGTCSRFHLPEITLPACRPFLAFFYLVLFLGEAFCQPAFIRKGGGAGPDEALDIESDAFGNIYVTGYFTGVADFSGATTISLNSFGADDIFLAKYNAAGNLIWLKQAGGSGPDRGIALAVMDNGTCYLTGYFSGSANFGSIPMTSTSGSPDVFTAKYSSAGNAVWVKKGGGPGNDRPYGIATDASGNCVITGETVAAVSFGAFGFTSMTDPGSGLPSFDVFAVRYNSTGNEVWLKHGAANHGDKGVSVVMDGSSNAYLLLQFSDTITFSSVYLNTMSNAIGLLKLDSMGNEQWMKTMGGSPLQAGYNLAIDNSANIFVTGDFFNSITFTGTPTTTLTGTGNYNFFIAKYNNSGNLQWATSAGSSSTVSSRSIALDNTGSIYITGWFRCRMDYFSAVYGQGIFNAIGYNDIFVAKYSPSGVFDWARQYGGKNNDYAYAIGFSTGVKPVIAGSFNRWLLVPSQGFAIPDGMPAYNVASGGIGTYCTDNNYGDYTGINSNGTLDIFLGNFIDPTREPYDYYYRTGTTCNRDVVPGCIRSAPLIASSLTCPAHPAGSLFPSAYSCILAPDTPCGNDTVTVCDSTLLMVSTKTSSNSPCDIGLNPSIGPDFRYYWSTGDTAVRGIIANATGLYTVHVTTFDQCFSFDDSIYLEVNPTSTALISDNHLVGTNSSGNYDLTFCDDTIVTFTGGNYSGNVYTWTGGSLPSGGINDTMITVSDTGTYTFTITTPEGCVDENFASIIYIQEIYPDTVVPVFIQNSTLFLNDTLPFCGPNLSMAYYIKDSATISCIPCQVTALQDSSYATLNGDTMPIGYSGTLDFCAGSINILNADTGWLKYFLYLEHSCPNLCGTDTIIYTLTDSVFVYPLPTPNITLSISGNMELCPGDTTTILASGPGTKTWFGGAYAGAIGDSIRLVNIPGFYWVQSNYSNSQGCTDSESEIFIVTIDQAVLFVSPDPALICPGDSVMLQAPPGTSYNWSGPLGTIGTSTSNPIYATNPGFYYVHMINDNGCELNSNTIQVEQFSTPYLFASPIAAVCQGNTVTVSAVSSPGSTITWLAPLSGSSPTQIIASPGIYSCAISSCGSTYLISIQINISTPLAEIFPSGEVILCPGDTIILTANPGMTQYLWSPGNETSQSIQVSTTGTFFVSTTNILGCDTVSSPVFVVPGTLPVSTVTDTTVCYGDPASLSASGFGTMNWYDDSSKTNLLFSGNPATTGPITSDTIFYLSEIFICEGNILPLNIAIHPNHLIFPEASVSQPICIGDTAFFTGSFLSGFSPNWSGPNGFSFQGQDFFLASTGFPDTGKYYYWLSDSVCPSTMKEVVVTLLPLAPAPVINSPSGLCPGDTLFLYSTPGTGVIHHWSGPSFNSTLPNPTIPDFSAAKAGLYTLFFSGLDCPSEESSTLISLHPAPEPNLGNDTALCFLHPLLLNPGNGFLDYLWQDNSTSGTHSAEVEGYYFVTVSNDFGCKATDTIFIKRESCPVVFDPPNIFSPNGDALNDFFNLENPDYLLKSCAIFNRWGKLVFQSSQPGEMWNGVIQSSGEKANDGTYFYMVEFLTSENLVEQKTGMVTLIRQ